MHGIFKKDIDEVEVDELKKIMDEYDNKTIVIDVRTPEEYIEEHVDGMVNFPLNSFMEHVNEICRHERVYIFCRSGSRSADAASQLVAAGITQAKNVRGGIIAWKANNYPTVIG